MPPPIDPTQDPDFMSAAPQDQIKYLSATDRDFAKATPADQMGYIKHLTSTYAPPLNPAPPPIPGALAPQPTTLKEAPQYSALTAPPVPKPTVSVEPNWLDKFWQETDQPDLPGSFEGHPENLAPFSKPVAIGAASAVAPELLPEMGGSVLPWLARAAASGVGAGVGTSAGQAMTGQNPIATPQLKETGQNAALAGGSELALGALPLLAGVKPSRGMMNASIGATARDVMYGNPAKALLREGIITPVTGDIELYKQALRNGASASDALVSAGGRVGAVSQRINQLAPQLESALQSSKQMIPVAQAIDKPLTDAAMSIITNRAMTEAEKDAAINQIGALQKALKEGLPNNITPLQANEIKQAVGDRVNWTGTTAVTDEVKPAYRTLYGSLKNAVNRAVPEAAGLNERLSDLLAAQGDLKKLIGAEEVGYGRGAMGSAVTGIARRLEAIGGRGIPIISGAGKIGQQFVPPALAAAPSVLLPRKTQ